MEIVHSAQDLFAASIRSAMLIGAATVGLILAGAAWTVAWGLWRLRQTKDDRLKQRGRGATSRSWPA
jgi:hypothetical protein